MAFTVDTNNLVSLGSAYLITGTYESVTSIGSEAILPNSTIANGTIAHLDSVAGDTIAWTAVYK